MNKSFSYVIQYAKAADKFFKVHEDVREQYENALKELLIGMHPERIDVKLIKGKKTKYYRIRLDEYRVIYTIINNSVVVIDTLLAGTRGDIYKKMGGLK